MSKDSVFRLQVVDGKLSFPDKEILQKKLESLKDGLYTLHLTKKSRLRSNQQNRYLRALYTIVSNETGYSEDDVHAMMGQRFLLIEKKVGVHIMKFVRSTASLDSKEMTDHIEKVRKFWGDEGIFLPEADDWYLLTM